MEQMVQSDNVETLTLGSLPVRLVARTALYTGLMTGIILGLLALMPQLTGGHGYLQILQTEQITPEQLLPAMLILGFSLLCIVAMTTWMVVLYSSFTVAGPLYRFSRDLEVMAGRPGFHGIRSGDYLQDVSGQLKSSMQTLIDYYGGIYDLADQAMDEVEHVQHQEEITAMAARLQRHVEQVRLS